MDLRERVPGRHHDHVVPLVARDRHELRVIRQGLGGDRQVGLAPDHELRELVGAALQELQANLGKGLLERRHHLRQRVPRLSVGHGHGEVPASFVRVLLADGLEAGDLREGPVDAREDFPAGLGDGDQPLALPLEDPDAEFLLQRPHLPGNARLGRVKRQGGLRHVEAAPRDLGRITQLLQVQGLASSK